MGLTMTQADCNISTHSQKSVPSNIAADPIGAVLILSGPPGETGTAPAILLRADGTATALHAIPGADGVWSLSEPIEPLTPQKVRDCFLGMRAIRKEAAHEIERLIALLDRLDAPGTDLEPDEDDEPQGDEEPSLGSVDNAANQEKWAPSGSYGLRDIDLEEQHDGREPDVDDEEDDPGEDADTGIGDDGGLAEQTGGVL
jgi:hypothetical protein